MGAEEASRGVATSLGRLCVVSRSGRCPRASAVHLLVTEESAASGCAERRRVAVTSPGDAGAWFPMGFFRACVHAFAAALGHELVVPLVEVCVQPGHGDVLLLDAGAGPAAALLANAERKLGALDLVATAPGELGHGLHAQLAATPGRFRVHVPPGPRAEDIAVWCHRHGVGVRRLAWPLAAAASRPLEAALLVLDAVAARCRLRGLDPARRPIAAGSDGLRGGPAGW